MSPNAPTGLTDAEIDSIFAKHFNGYVTLADQRAAARAIEAEVRSLAAAEQMEQVALAYYIYIPRRQHGYVVEELDYAIEDLTFEVCEVKPLYASPLLREQAGTSVADSGARPSLPAAA